jgi:hypothetical protein
MPKSLLAQTAAVALALMATSGSTATANSVAEVYRTSTREALPLNLYPIIMTHDSATGELDEQRDYILADWAKTQSATLVNQLNCGARAFDYRPKLEKDKQIYAHHGGVTIRVPMSDSVKGIMAWANANPDDLVILYLSHFDGDGCEDEVVKLLTTLRVKMIRNTSTTSCQQQLQGLTYGKAKSMSTLHDGPGSVLAIFDCTEENFDPTINCYNKDYTCYDSWPENTKDIPFDHLHSYMVNTTLADPTKTNANMWMTQAHWQSSAASITLGTLHRSSLLEDEKRSGLNLWVKQMVQNQEMSFLNVLELEDACDHGLEVYDAIKQVYLSGGNSQN